MPEGISPYYDVAAIWPIWQNRYPRSHISRTVHRNRLAAAKSDLEADTTELQGRRHDFTGNDFRRSPAETTRVSYASYVREVFSDRCLIPRMTGYSCGTGRGATPEGVMSEDTSRVNSPGELTFFIPRQ